MAASLEYMASRVHPQPPIPQGTLGSVGSTDANGNLWLFGGAGFDAADTNGNLNDLWKFSPSTGEWTWVGGSSHLGVNGTVAGVYGTLGSLTAGSFPGSRNNGVAWTSKDGSLWLFGGYGGSTLAQFGALNDLWRYVPSTNQWAWMGGSSTTLQPGVYGQLGAPAPGNVPGARESAGAWVDNYGNFWLFGGNGYALAGQGDLNDLWKFDPTTNEWAWMSGSNSPASCRLDLQLAWSVRHAGHCGCGKYARQPRVHSYLDKSGRLALALWRKRALTPTTCSAF